MPISPAEQEELNRQLIVACEDDSNLDLVQSLLDIGRKVKSCPEEKKVKKEVKK